MREKIIILISLFAIAISVYSLVLNKDFKEVTIELKEKYPEENIALKIDPFEQFVNEHKLVKCSKKVYADNCNNPMIIATFGSREDLPNLKTQKDSIIQW